MRTLFFFTIVLVCFSGCKKENKKLDVSPKTFYLNKDSIEIIEFSKNKITRYLFKQNSSVNINLDDINFLDETNNSLSLKYRPNLIYKSVEIDTNYMFNLKSNEYWNHKVEGKSEDWYSFYTDTIDELLDGNKQIITSYRIYEYNEKTKDTIYSYDCSSREMKGFDKFNAFDFGPFCSSIGIISEYENDTLKIIPLISFNKKLDYNMFYFTKYNSRKSNLYIGDWELTNSAICDIFEYYGGNKVKISKDSIIFSNDQEQLTTLKYTLGLDSKFLNISTNGINNFKSIKILKNDLKSLELRLRYHGGLCKSDEILIYNKINPE